MNLLNAHRCGTRIRVTSADISGFLQQLANQEIIIHEVVYVDALHSDITISSKDLSRIQSIACKRGDTVQLMHRRSIGNLLKDICKRPVLAMGMLVVLFLSCWLPTRVFFVRVEGNTHVSNLQIIEQAELCGVEFGASRRKVRSEVMKNRLLSAMPQLQWAGITTSGCTAVITVRERNDVIEVTPSQGLHNLIAIRDAVVGEMTVQTGTALCKPGQAVKQGQVLVSPYEDCGICLRATGAVADIFGQTKRQLTLICPTKYEARTLTTHVTKKFSLIIGKKRIKFYKGSGISGGTCAKIYEEKYITLPGGFVLPIALVCEQTTHYQSQSAQSQLPETFMENFARQYLMNLMQSGKVLDSHEAYFHGDEFCRLDGVYHCYEMIARPEELRKTYE